MRKYLRYLIYALCAIAVCRVSAEDAARVELLKDEISKAAADYPGRIGVAVIIDNADTVTVNDECRYQLMSVFKMHQALAVCGCQDRRRISLDSVLTVSRDSLDAGTWSPMMKEHTGPVIGLTVRELLRYALILSDNNASNIMFEKLVGTEQTDSFIATLIPRPGFRIAYTEREMSKDRSLADFNCTSPLSAAVLMNRLFTDSLISSDMQRFVTETMRECRTGNDRIAAPLIAEEGVTVAHKTGSGFTDENGVLSAHNDVAYITLPDGLSYTLAVFVKDFKGDGQQASAAIARISGIVYSYIRRSYEGG